jgi:hypothetical protein
MRYTLTAALDKILVAAKNGSVERSGDMFVTSSSTGKDSVETAASAMSCPVVGSDSNLERHLQQKIKQAPPSLNPMLYGAMDVDQRTAIVHKHLPSGLLDFVEAALQVCIG